MVTVCLLRLKLDDYRKSTPEGITGYGGLLWPNLTTGDSSIISNTDYNLKSL